MRKILLIFPIIGLIGCVAPATLKPIAIDNQKNIDNLSSNVNKILPEYGKLLNSFLQLRYQTKRKELIKTLRQYENMGVINSKKLENDVKSLKDLVQYISNIQDQVKKEKKQSELLLRNPIVADIAFNKISQDDAESLISMYIQTSKENVSLLNSVAELITQRFYITKDALALNSEILAAFKKMSETIEKQIRLAKQHGQAVKKFSESNSSFSDFITIMSSDSTKTSIAELVGATTKDPNRKKAAEAALAEFNNLLE